MASSHAVQRLFISSVSPWREQSQTAPFLRSVGAQAFLLPENGETERGVKTIDKLGGPFA